MGLVDSSDECCICFDSLLPGEVDWVCDMCGVRIHGWCMSECVTAWYERNPDKEIDKPEDGMVCPVCVAQPVDDTPGRVVVVTAASGAVVRSTDYSSGELVMVDVVIEPRTSRSNLIEMPLDTIPPPRGGECDHTTCGSLGIMLLWVVMLIVIITWW